MCAHEQDKKKLELTPNNKPLGFLDLEDDIPRVECQPAGNTEHSDVQEGKKKSDENESSHTNSSWDELPDIAPSQLEDTHEMSYTQKADDEFDLEDMIPTFSVRPKSHI